MKIEDLKDIEKLNDIKVDYNIKSDAGKKYRGLKNTCNIKSRIVEKLKIECSNIESQIKSLNKTSTSLTALTKHTDEHKACPLCSSSTDKIFEPYIKAKEKIISEQKFLNNYSQDILHDKFELRKEELNTVSNDLEIFLEQLDESRKDAKEVKSMEDSIALQNELKGIIKASIKNIEKYEELKGV